MSNSIREWIRKQQPLLEDIIVEAGQTFHEEHLAEPTYAHHLRTARIESYGLSNGKDLCYDTPAIGLMYSLWYHPRRVNTSLSMITNSLIEAAGKSIDLFDLGSGSGAMQWACGLVYAAMHENGFETPDLRIVSIDTSPFMTEYQRRLWKYFAEKYPVCKEIQSEYEVNSWVNHRKEYNPIWISASYLFDHSEKKSELQKAFKAITTQSKPERILLSTSFKKLPMVNAVAHEILTDEYVSVDVDSDYLLSGDLPKVTAVRHKLDEMLRMKQSQTTTWREFSFIASVFKRKQADLAFKRTSGNQALSRIDLFNPPITVRHDIQLAEDQIDAAKHNPRPTVIYGPAGCGKSVVITERIKNLVEEEKYAPNLRILLTTFNKELIQTLYEWLDDVLDSRYYRTEGRVYGDHEFYFRESNHPNITLLHFDVLPTRIGGFNGSIMHESIRDRLITQLIEEVEEEMHQQEVKINQPERILNHEFIREEYERVFYGLSLREERTYLNGMRPGRPRLVRNQKPRQVAWWCMEKLDRAVNTSKHGLPFVNKRLQFHEALKSGSNNNLFTYIFIDEFQDCTEADFEMFYSLLENPNYIVAGGDLAQALHLGRSATLPRLSPEQRNRDKKLLEGSYRLPFRISEALVGLSDRIAMKRQNVGDMSDIGRIHPYKGSPPGARPIVIWGPDVQALAEKAASVLRTYKVYDVDKVKVIETDNDLATQLNRRLEDIRVGGDSVLRIKGLETPCVIWSTRRPVLFKEEVEEFVYTILTRTAGLLIIALSPETCDMYRPILNTFKEEQLIFWDWPAKQRFKDYVGDVELSDDFESHSDVEEPLDLQEL